MEKSRAVRVMDNLGRIVIPADVCTMMDWGSNSVLEVWADSASNTVMLKTHTHTCSYCGATENLKVLKRHHICPTCQEAISKL